MEFENYKTENAQSKSKNSPVGLLSEDHSLLGTNFESSNKNTPNYRLDSRLN